MIENANLFLKVEEQVGHSDKEKRIKYIPINSSIENMRLFDIPAYSGMENASVYVMFDTDSQSNVSRAYADCWLAGETTVKGFTIFSLMESITNNSSMKRTMASEPSMEVDPKITEELENKEQLAIKALSNVMDEQTLNMACERLRTLSTNEIYNFIDELGLLKQGDVEFHQ